MSDKRAGSQEGSPMQRLVSPFNLEPREGTMPGGGSAWAGMVPGRLQVWNCGGGRQSAGIAALICQGRLPRPDVSLIVDTGREKRSTWTYLETVIRPALERVGVGIVVVPKERYATCDLWSTNGTILEIPAFTNQSGEAGKLPNFCSNEWKTRVAARWLREQGHTKWQRWLGFSIEEPRRWVKHLDSEEIWLPLVRGVRMRKVDCGRAVKQMGWPAAPGSACWMCPNLSDDEWLDIKENSPDEFREAVALDYGLREKDPHAYLHEQCVPLDQVDWSKPPELPFERACNSGNCFV
jgi:hypothetical protein